MHMAKWEWKKLLRERKTKLVLAAFFIFYATFSLLYKRQSITFPEEQLKDRYDQIHQFFNSVPGDEFTGETGEEVYDILSDLQLFYGMQHYILSKQNGNKIKGFEDLFSDYLEYGTQIARLQGQILEIEGLDKFTYVDFLRSIIPDKKTIQKDLAFYNYMEEHDLEIEWNSFSASNVLIEEVNFMLGFTLFLFIALLAADRFTKDQTKNWSITQGIPVSWRKQWHLRTGLLWLLIWMVSLSGLLISYFISYLLETPGNLQYPVMVYTSSGYVPIAIWKYTFLASALGMVLSYFLTLLTVGLSWMIRTVYLTIVLVAAIYFIPFLWQIVHPFSSWQPSLYFHIEPVLSGKTAETTGLPDVSFLKGLVAIAILLLALEGIFTFIFDRIQTKSLGLRRRTSS